jgi:putative ABC transport system ATP-binding protein
MNVVELRGVSKIYVTGETTVHALRPTDLVVRGGRFVAVIGPSGSGKSTLLNILGLLDRPSSGEYRLSGRPTQSLKDGTMASLRCRKMGMVFQSFNLFPRFTVLENVCVPMQYANVKGRQMRERAESLLKAVGLADRMHHKPTQLSGGESQRTAIARALANDPELILADEPTGNLDEHTGQEIMGIFRQLVRDGRTILMVTHNPEYMQYGERVIQLRDGSVVSQ